jgi:hypothetical protein
MGLAVAETVVDIAATVAFTADVDVFVGTAVLVDIALWVAAGSGVAIISIGV